MSESPNIIIETLKIVTSFLSENSISIIILVLLLICRDAISNFISRLTSFYFKNRNSELGLKAAAPMEADEKAQELKSAEEKPGIDDDSSDIEDKAEGKDWFFEMHTAFIEGRINEAETAFNKYALDETDEIKLEENTAFYLYFRFKKGKDNSAIGELEELARSAKTEDSKFNILTWLTICLNASMQNKKVIELWRAAAEEIEDQSLVTESIVNLSYALNDDNQLDEARKLLIDRLSDVQVDEQKSSLYRALSIIELSLGNKSISVYCKDKSLEFDLNNRDELFNSAYAASNEDIDEVSISNYVKLIKIDGENASALNNLGVRAQKAGLKIKAIDNYKIASGHNNTLAMSNQGYLLLNSGFTEEAEEIAKKALELDDTHQNIHTLITDINKKKEKQNDEWGELSNNALLRQKLMRIYIEQYYLGNSKALEGDWFAKNLYPTSVAISGNSLKASWLEEAGALGGDTYSAELTGKVTGSTFSGTYTRNRNADAKNTLFGLSGNTSTSAANTLFGLSGNTSTSCVGYIFEDGKYINILSSKFTDDFTLCLSRSKA